MAGLLRDPLLRGEEDCVIAPRWTRVRLKKIIAEKKNYFQPALFRSSSRVRTPSFVPILTRPHGPHPHPSLIHSARAQESVFAPLHCFPYFLLL